LTLATFLQLVVELVALFGAAMLAIQYVVQLGAPLADAAPTALVFAVVIVVLNGAFGIYRRVEPLSSRPYVLRMLLAAAIGIPLAFLIDGLVPGGGAFREHVILVIALALGLLVLRHGVVVPLLATYAPHRVLVLGTGAEAQDVETSLRSAEPMGLRLVGFFPLEKNAERAVSGARIVGGDSLFETVRRLRVAEIIVAVREQRGGVLPLRELLDCRLGGVKVTDLPGFYEAVHGYVPLDSVKASWLIYAHGYRQHLVRALIKRTFDIVVSFALLVAALPLMAVFAALIALETGRPIVYRQARVGRGGVPFTVFKFRSMAKDAEKDRQPTWATANDSRVTRIGRLMRRTRIDELPQLFNVLRGEMSFVGPRPERPEFVAMLTERIPFYAARHSVKPGLTGWAQVRYCYGATVEQAAKKLEYDLYYVKNHTLTLDMIILLETVRVVMLGEGAR
jgi:sugar transferase (PEP-CTERM system associated)